MSALESGTIAAIVLAAGRSQRMGRPKMVLPWGNRTVIGQVVQTLLNCAVNPILVVTGADREAVEAALKGLPVETAYNEKFANGEMLVSLQTGLQALIEREGEIEAALIVLGDQPQMEQATVEQMIASYRKEGSRLSAPSYQRRRGHPWLVERSLWPEMLSLTSPHTLRDFMKAHEDEIHYLPGANDSILKDLDTPADYTREQDRLH